MTENRPKELSSLHSERRESPPVESAARLVIFKSRTSESLLEREGETPLADVFLTHTLFVSRGEDPKVLSPVGGRIDNVEDLEGKAKAKALQSQTLQLAQQQTTVLPSQGSIRLLQNSHIVHSTTGGPDRRVYTAHVTINPGDRLHEVQPTQEGHATIVPLSLPELQQLFETGEVIVDGNQYTCIPSMSPQPSDDAEYKPNGDLSAVHNEILSQMYRKEALKKAWVVAHLLRNHKITYIEKVGVEKVGRLQYLNQEIFRIIADIDDTDPEATKQYARAYHNMKRFWKHIMNLKTPPPEEKPLVNYEDVGKVLDQSATEESVYHLNVDFDEQTGRGIPAVDFSLPMLIDEEPLTRAELRSFAGNPRSKKMLKALSFMRGWYFSRQEGSESNEEVQRHRKIYEARAKRLQTGKIEEAIEPLQNIEEVITFLADTHIMPTELHKKERELSQVVNGFFRELNNDLKLDGKNGMRLDQMREIETSHSIERLIGIAIGDESAFPQTYFNLQDTDKRSAYKKIIVWEAQRKLLLMSLLNDASYVQDTELDKGIEAIEKIQHALKEMTTGGDMRKITLNGVEHSVEIHHREKEVTSIARKMLGRNIGLGSEKRPGDVATDVYGKAYVFRGKEQEEIQRMGEMVTVTAQGEIFDAKGRPVEEIHAPRCVAEFMNELLKKSQETCAEGETAKITEYKPLSNNGIESNGPGGGGKVRLAKFKLVHTDALGVERMEEIQVYAPHLVDGEWQDGSYDYDNKKYDDETYRQLRRITGLRASEIEILFPYRIYGDRILEVIRYLRAYQERESE